MYASNTVGLCDVVLFSLEITLKGLECSFTPIKGKNFYFAPIHLTCFYLYDNNIIRWRKGQKASTREVYKNRYRLLKNITICEVQGQVWLREARTSLYVK